MIPNADAILSFRVIFATADQISVILCIGSRADANENGEGIMSAYMSVSVITAVCLDVTPDGECFLKWVLAQKTMPVQKEARVHVLVRMQIEMPKQG